MFDISDLIAFVALCISIIGWLYAANARRQLQRQIRKSVIVGSRLNVVDEYLIEAGRLAEKVQELLALKLQARKMGLFRRAGNDIAQVRVWFSVRKYNSKINELELNVSDILEIIENSALEARKHQLQATTKKLYNAVRTLQTSNLQEYEIEAAIEQSEEMLTEIKAARVAFRREIDEALLNW